MRRLNQKQKSMLRSHADKLPDDGILFYDVEKDDTMSGDLYEEIMLLNDFETFYQEVNNFISEYKMKGV